MRVEIFKHDIRIDQKLEQTIQYKTGKVEKRLKRYHPDAADLEIRLQHNPKSNEFACALNLKAFRDSMHTQKSAPNLRVAVDKSFDALFKELEHYRQKINPAI